MLILLNHLDPDSTDLSSLPNFQRLKNHSLSFGQASVGHLFPIPQVSHLVITAGRVPSHLPWTDNVFWDRAGVLGKKEQFHSLNRLTAPAFSKILSGVNSSLLRKIPGPANSKLVIAPKIDEAFPLASPTTESRILTGDPTNTAGSEAWVTDGILSFFTAEPDWKMVMASFDNPNPDFLKSDEQLGRILDYLEQNNLLSETAIILTSHPKTSAKDPVLRYYLKDKDLKSVLKLGAALKGKRGISEVYYKKEISGRFHYIRVFRSSPLQNQLPSLLQSLASENSPDVLAFSAESPPRIPLFVWSPNLRFDNPVIKNQIEQTHVRFVDLHPIVLALLGLPQDSGLDGSSLGIESLIY